MLKKFGLTAKAKKALDASVVKEYDPDFCVIAYLSHWDGMSLDAAPVLGAKILRISRHGHLVL